MPLNIIIHPFTAVDRVVRPGVGTEAPLFALLEGSIVLATVLEDFLALTFLHVVSPVTLVLLTI